MKRVLLVLAAATLLCFSMLGRHQLEVSADVYSKDKENVIRELLATRLDENGRVHLIVGVDAAFQPEGNLKVNDIDSQRRSIRSAQRLIIDDYAARGVNHIKEFEYIPYLAFEADNNALESMISDRRINFVQEDVASAPAYIAATGPDTT